MTNPNRSSPAHTQNGGSQAQAPANQWNQPRHVPGTADPAVAAAAGLSNMTLNERNATSTPPPPRGPHRGRTRGFQNGSPAPANNSPRVGSAQPANGSPVLNHLLPQVPVPRGRGGFRGSGRGGFRGRGRGQAPPNANGTPA